MVAFPAFMPKKRLSGFFMTLLEIRALVECPCQNNSQALFVIYLWPKHQYSPIARFPMKKNIFPGVFCWSWPKILGSMDHHGTQVKVISSSMALPDSLSTSIRLTEAWAPVFTPWIFPFVLPLPEVQDSVFTICWGPNAKDNSRLLLVSAGLCWA